MKFYRLKNNYVSYPWGSINVLASQFGIPHCENEKVAEIWMGGHPKLSSELEIAGKLQPLNRWLAALPAQQKIEQLGHWAEQGTEFPFLAKILSAASPLSIQVHPNLDQAQRGFQLENASHQEASCRNYKDGNHKPEILIALSHFVAVAGFKTKDDTESLLASLGKHWCCLLAAYRSTEHVALKSLYLAILQTSPAEKKVLIKELIDYCMVHQDEAPMYREVLNLAEYYPADIAIVSPLIFNLFSLTPGEALFVPPGTPHAYLRGTGIEVMASSDNVIRGGLTAKYIDYTELANVMSDIASPIVVKPAPSQIAGLSLYPTPVKDFCVSLAEVKDTMTLPEVTSCTIVFLLNGSLTVSSADEQFVLAKPGQSLLVTTGNTPWQLNGTGQLLIVTTDL